MTKKDNEYLTLPEVAVLAQLTRQGVHFLAKSGKLKTRRMGKRFLVCKRRDVEAWLHSRQQAAAA
jgi:excisionase family DNA binding protein